MKSRTMRAKAVAAAALVAGLALSGCAINSEPNASPAQSPQSSATDFSGYDIMFAQMMIPHHQQAVDMGTLAETRAFSPEVKALAAQIKAEQAPEIAQMKTWLTNAGKSMDMGHEMTMDGMLSDAEFTALENSTGTEFDKLYLQGMIGHHEGAIKMAQMVVDSTNAEAKALGDAVVKSQTKQIEYMKSLLSK